MIRPRGEMAAIGAFNIIKVSFPHRRSALLHSTTGAVVIAALAYGSDLLAVDVDDEPGHSDGL